MLLDSGEGAHSAMEVERAGLESLLSAGTAVGPALRMLREAQGLSLQDIAAATCIRRLYLQALEDNDLDKLPKGPFAAGYVRAYAQALGARSDLAVAHFRKEAPASSEALKAPTGVKKPRDARLSWLAGACAVVGITAVAWNLAQHAVAHDGGPTPPVRASNAPPPASLSAGRPVALGAPQPAPADSDVPTPYVTPGMAKALGTPEPAPAPAKAALNPRAAVYGAPADRSTVTLRALRAASLVIRGSDGSIYFARQLAAGESYRAPAGMQNLTVDVSEPGAFNVIRGGQAVGPLQAAQTPIGKLSG